MRFVLETGSYAGIRKKKKSRSLFMHFLLLLNLLKTVSDDMGRSLRNHLNKNTF